jgi:hypothetical protein
VFLLECERGGFALDSMGLELEFGHSVGIAHRQA